MPRSSRPVAVAALLTVLASAQSPVIVPNGYAATEAANENGFPWDRNWESMHIQFVHDSVNFTNQSISGPILIQAIAYRADDTTASWSGGSWPNVHIEMATCPTDYTAVASTFALNLDLDRSIVHDGPVNVLPGTGNGIGVPGPIYVRIPLLTPFFYDPSAGKDIVVDIQLDGTGWSGQSTSSDYADTFGPFIPLCSRIWNPNSADAPSGYVDVDYGPVCEFTYVTAPALYAHFGVTVNSAPSPMTVNFVDLTYTDDPGGVVAWAWDFENDGTIDSTAQNPTHTFASCGTYDVALTAFDSTHPPHT